MAQLTFAAPGNDNSRDIKSRVWRTLRALALVWPALFWVAAASSAAAQSGDSAPSLERRVKAAFLYKFSGYIEWPEGSFSASDAPISIGVIGDDQLASDLTQMVAGHTIDNRALAIKRINDPAAAEGVNIVFVGHAEIARLPQLIKATSGRHLLIVTESDGALAQGSMINFVVNNGHVRFELSADSAEKRQLKFSSRLLTVAQNMRAGAP
jgi:hypothetical protein